MKGWLRTTLMILFACIFLVSGYFLLDYFLESGKEAEQFDQLAAIMEQSTVPFSSAETLPQVIPTDPVTQETIPVSPYVQVRDPETGEMVELLPEFAELYAMNNDIVGWITIDGTRVHYPVMQTPDAPNHYLKRNFDGTYSAHGCIYARESCDVFLPSDNITIYGHRMKDGSMFSDLSKYTKKSFWQEHPYITFNTLKERHTYQIAFVFTIESSADSPFQYHLFVDAADQAHFDSFVESCRSYAIYDTGTHIRYGDKLITLSTCEYSQTNGRLVVVAKLLPENGEK